LCFKNTISKASKYGVCR